MSLWRFVIGIQGCLVALFSSCHDLMCLNWQLYFWSLQMGSSISTKEGKGTDILGLKEYLHLESSVSYSQAYVNDRSGAGWCWVEERGVCTPLRPNSLSSNWKAEPILASLSTQPRWANMRAPCDFCDLREELTVFFTTLSKETYDEVPCFFLGPAALPSRLCGWRAPLDLGVTQRVPLPRGQGVSHAQQASACLGPVTTPTTVMTGEKTAGFINQWVGGSSRNIRTIGFPSVPELFFIVLA